MKDTMVTFTGDPFVSFALERFGKSVIKKLSVLYGVKEEVEEMQIELQWMQSFLEDADNHVQAQSHQHHSRVFRRWVSQIKEASLDAEYIVDTYMVNLALRKRADKFNLINIFSCIINEGINRHELGSEIEVLKSKLATLRTRLQTYGAIRELRLGEESSSSFGGQGQLWQRQTYGHIVDPNVVGLDGKTEDVVRLFLGGEERCRVVAIYGMGGLGKTTLAKKVYHNNLIRSCFYKFVWVPISQQFNARAVWETIFIELTSPSLEQRMEIKAFGDNEIVPKLCQVLKDHECFIVLDDIRSIGHWQSLSAAFSMDEPDATRSKILITTRKKEVAELVDRKGSYGGLGPLSPDQSCELLQKLAFAGRYDFEDKERKETLGREMIEHCRGLPLAIVVLAGTLATKESLREWQIVHDNVKAYLRRGKVGNNEQCLGVNAVLAFSYYDLPHQLKYCFLYLSQFPKDYEIQTSRLLKMWIAEGFVSIENEGDGELETIEDVAERCLNELVGRGMILVGKEGSTGRIRTCRMHDLMRDMCLSKAKEENFTESFIGGIVTNSVGKVRRLSLFLDGDHSIFHDERKYQLRSFILYSDCSTVRAYEDVLSKQMITNFKLLKMLVMERIYIGDKKILKAIGDLIKLKYLSLRGSKVLSIPPMKKLRCLETLDLQVDFISTPSLDVNAIWMMKNLRHLYLPSNLKDSRSSNQRVQIGTDNENVQTLVNFPPPNCPLGEVVKFPNVRKLRIRRRESSTEFGQIFRSEDNHKKAEFRRLSSLSALADETDRVDFATIDLEGILMGCPNVYKLRLHGRLVSFPPEVSQLATNLTKLILRGSVIEDPKHIETNLGMLPKLKILHLVSNAFSGSGLCFQLGSFGQLKSLLLESLRDLKEWRVEKGAMPILESLEIGICDELQMVPEGLRFIDTLKELRIIDMPENFIERVREGEPDFDKVKHVPTIIITESIREETGDWRRRTGVQREIGSSSTG